MLFHISMNSSKININILQHGENTALFHTVKVNGGLLCSKKRPKKIIVMTLCNLNVNYDKLQDI